MIELHNYTFDGYTDDDLNMNNLYIYLRRTLELNNFVLKNGTIWTRLYDDENDENDYIENYDNSCVKYKLILPSILDLCVLTFYNKYDSVCRWES